MKILLFVLQKKEQCTFYLYLNLYLLRTYLLIMHSYSDKSLRSSEIRSVLNFNTLKLAEWVCFTHVALWEFGWPFSALSKQLSFFILVPWWRSSKQAGRATWLVERLGSSHREKCWVDPPFLKIPPPHPTVAHGLYGLLLSSRFVFPSLVELSSEKIKKNQTPLGSYMCLSRDART